MFPATPADVRSPLPPEVINLPMSPYSQDLSENEDTNSNTSTVKRPHGHREVRALWSNILNCGQFFMLKMLLFLSHQEAVFMTAQHRLRQSSHKHLLYCRRLTYAKRTFKHQRFPHWSHCLLPVSCHHDSQEKQIA